MATPKFKRAWRGRFRAQLQYGNRLLNSMLKYNTKHEANPPFSTAEVTQIQEVIATFTQLLEAQVIGSYAVMRERILAELAAQSAAEARAPAAPAAARVTRAKNGPAAP